MSKCNNSVAAFTKAKLEQFKSVIAESEGGPILSALKKANYRIEQVGTTLNCQKGHAIISFDGITSEATITLI